MKFLGWGCIYFKIFQPKPGKRQDAGEGMEEGKAERERAGERTRARQHMRGVRQDQQNKNS